MNGVEYVRELCKKQGLAVSKLEKDLGFANGYLNPKKMENLPYDRAVLVHKYLGGDIKVMMGIDDNTDIPDTKYYINEETAKIAQEIFENRELRLLFDASRDADPEDIKTVHDMLLALKRKERGYSDE